MQRENGRYVWSGTMQVAEVPCLGDIFLPRYLWVSGSTPKYSQWTWLLEMSQKKGVECGFYSNLSWRSLTLHCLFNAPSIKKDFKLNFRVLISAAD